MHDAVSPSLRCTVLSATPAGADTQAFPVSSASSPIKLIAVFAERCERGFFCRRIAPNVHPYAPISVSSLMLVKSYFHWGTQLKFCQGTKKGSDGRSQPRRDDAVSVGGDALHRSMHAAGGLMRSRV
jgi:hypothetical protein